MGVGGVMVAAVRMGFGRATRWSFGGRAWASGVAAGMVLAGAAIVLLAWTVDSSPTGTSSNADVRDGDLDDSAHIIVTADGSTIFGAPFRLLVAAPADVAASRADAAARQPSGGSHATGSAVDPGPRPRPVTGGGTSTPTPATPAPTTGGGDSSGAGPAPDPGATPPPGPMPIPAPPSGGTGTPAAGIKVAVTAPGATASVVSITHVDASSSTSAGTTVAVTLPVASVSASLTGGSATATTATPGPATVTAGGITLDVPLLGTLLG